MIDQTELTLQRLARERMKLLLYHDILMDMTVCEIEGWSKMEYLKELKACIDTFFERIDDNGQQSSAGSTQEGVHQDV